jgi:hypothetical protein
MSEQAQHAAQPVLNLPGYLFRRAPLTSEGLLDLLQNEVFQATSVFAFGANSVVIEPIRQYQHVSAISLTSGRGAFDFGHVFSPQAEVRWKRKNNTYDALILTEDASIITAMGGVLQALGDPYTTVRSPSKIDILINTPRNIERRAMRWRLGYIEYRAKNQAVQFLRYTKLREEPV